jgi:hypothetical protein
LSEATREAILAALTTDEVAGVEDGSAGDDRVANRAVALKAVLPETTELTLGERALLSEWLDRITDPAR